jgi:hypothetical protein
LLTGKQTKKYTHALLVYHIDRIGLSLREEKRFMYYEYRVSGYKTKCFELQLE